ncbi:phage holin family protein [Microbacterium saperdae]|uniref:Superfamily IV 4 TMS phage holin n=1 Tax=Microbacterium saperdae TaxID=69368 RepID=A0A543BNW6_9MICO|nr:phage holin family protein [Microbacterium saperdae]TQL86524.1 superfamily IV 4 TMS phage holin [Microbacterium saperdae]GGM47412.1 membrane protein [Microbacterium saperdae]
MITLLFRTGIYLLSAAIGLIVADLVLDGFEIVWSKWWGFVVCILIFALLQSILSPWITKIADRYAPVLLGGIGIFSTLIALVIVVLLPIGGLRITDAAGWILGSVIVWLVTALGSVLLPMIFVKRKVKEARGRR